ncbi:MAG: DNA polymerase (family 10) [Verrucomicrobiales bacterium]|jgi:DNA polymerase (family 10)
MTTPDEIVSILRKIAQLLELKGENPFKVRAYRNGADAVETFSGDFVQLAIDDQLKPIKGIGDALAKKLHQLAATGKMEFWENLKEEFPESIFELFDIPGLGPKKVKALYDEFEVSTVEDLKSVCESGQVAKLAGFGAKSVEKILQGIEYRASFAGRFRLGDVAAEVDTILEGLRSHPATARAETAGSVRRGKETVHDLDFIVATKKPQEIMDFFVGESWTAETLVHGATKSSIRLANGVQCDLRAVSNEEYPFALAYFTGSKEHNVAIRGRALKHGFTLNEYRLAPTEGSDAKPPEINDEADLYSALGLDYVEPALRENTGEIQAAEEGKLPQLIERENLRGTFHNHTTASDGKNSLREMAEAAQELGLQYLGIADHSKSSFQANGLDEDRLRQQLLEIRELNAEFGGDFRIFAGSEVDILRDGGLDFDDDLLSELDYVVASVHNAMQLDEKTMTARILSAVENPHVTMLGHLTGRLLLQREPYAVNIPKIIDACAETATIIELNCNTWRLDMDWRWWKLATEKGVKCSINPDAHRTSDLQYLHFGILIARKGWLTRDDVVNCLPLGEIEAVLESKN